MTKRILLILLAVVIYFVLNTLDKSGFFKSVSSSFEGSVVQVFENMPGTEDLALDAENGMMFISATDRWGEDNSKDGIYLLNLESLKEPQKLPTDFLGDLHPHGISFLIKDSIRYLFVVNHNAKGEFVEIFQHARDSLIHLQSVMDELMCCPNDVVGIDKDQFYVTNDHGTKTGFMRTLEDYLRIPGSNIVFYDGSSFRKVYSRLNYGNGIAISTDKRLLYVAETTGRRLTTLQMGDKGDLDLVGQQELKTGVDNIFVDPGGNLWIGAHPKLLSFVAHSKDPYEISPSQVLKLTPTTDGAFSVTEVYVDDGVHLSGSSVAVTYKDLLVVGVVFENKLLVGRMD